MLRLRPVLLCLVFALGLTGLPVRPPVAEARPAADLGGELAALAYDSAEVLVQIRNGLEPGAAGDIAEDHGLEFMQAIAGSGFLVFATEGRDTNDVVRDLARDPRVEIAEPNYVRRVESVPNDPYFDDYQDDYLSLIRLPEAWDLTTGDEDVTLAVVDSGVKLNHPDLAGRLLSGRDIVNDDDTPEDDEGHGTQVATVAAATGNDGRGMAGAAWRGKILPVKVIDEDGQATDSNVAAGIRWAVDHGADVINLSFGGPQPATQIVRQAVQYAHDRDVLIVAAAGNGGGSYPTYPAALDSVLAVTATDHQGRFAGFSDSGPWVDVAAPGIDIMAGWRDGTYRLNTGTSLSSPLVAGVAMLVRSRFPGDSADEIARRIQLGAADTGPFGFDTAYGYGLVDAMGALGGTPRTLPIDAAAILHEPDNTPDRATNLNLATANTATLAPEQDVDWFSVDISAPRRHEFTVVPPPTEDDSPLKMDPVLAVFNPDLVLLEEMNANRAGQPETITIYTATPGRYYLRVRNHLWTAGPGPYQVKVSSVGGPAQVSFDTAAHGYASALGGSATAVGDLTGDGVADVIMSQAHPAASTPDRNYLLLLPRAGDGFGPPVTIPTYGVGSTDGLGLTLMDVDGDGDRDVALATEHGIEVFHQNGGRLTGVTLLPTVGPARQVETGDVDGDGFADLVVATTSGGIKVLPNLGGAEFGAPRDVTSVRAAEIEVADLEGDGRHEIVALECDPDCRDVALYRFASGGVFTRTATRMQAPEGEGTCGSNGAIGVGDVMGDRDLDVFATCTGVSSQVFLMTLGPTGALERHPNLSNRVTERYVALESADIDRDGRDEIIALPQTHEYAYALWLTPAGELGDVFDLAGMSYDERGPKSLAVGDLDGDGASDLAAASWDSGLNVVTVKPTIPAPALDHPIWIRDTSPAEGSYGAPDATPAVRFGRPVDPGSATRTSVRLVDALTGTVIPAGVTYDPTTNSVVLHPDTPLTPGRPYRVEASGLRDTSGATMPASECCFRFAVLALLNPPSPPVDTEPAGTTPKPTPTTPPRRTGYWMATADGAVYSFGEAGYHGGATPSSPNYRIVDLEPTPTGAGYWMVDGRGSVTAHGDAVWFGDADPARLTADEGVTSLSRTPTGRGYWLFTTKGRVLTLGDAPWLGDMSAVRLNGPVLDSIPTPTGDGYYMVASDGGIFSFGDARFFGSMGGHRLNAPVQSLVPDTDGVGYWLVASDGGVFSFDAPFRGSMGAVALNRPVTGMVPFGNGYLMVGEDGGIFNFSDLPFYGSLGSAPPSSPVVTVAAL